MNIFNPFKKKKNQPTSPFSLSSFIDETDYDYGRASDAAYLVGTPHNTLSPYELKHILDNAEQLTILSISTQIELPEDSVDPNIDSAYIAQIQVICLVADNLVLSPQTGADNLVDTDHHVQLPNVIPVAILRNKDYEQINEMTGTCLEIAKNIVSTYANMLTMQGYEIQWAAITPTLMTGLSIDIAANQPVEISFTSNTMSHRNTFQNINKTPFQPGKMYTDNDDKKDHIIIFPHREIASDGIIEPIARYEEAMSFFTMASEAPELFHSDTKLQRVYHARIVQAAACVAQGVISLAHFADYVLRMNYEAFDIKDYDLHRACNIAELLLKNDPLKDPLYNPLHLDVIIPESTIHNHMHQYQKDAIKAITKTDTRLSLNQEKTATRLSLNQEKAAKDYNKIKETNRALMDIGVDFATNKEEAKRDAIAMYESGEPGYYNVIKRENIDEHGRVKSYEKFKVRDDMLDSIGWAINNDS